MRSLGPADALLTQRIDLEPSRVAVHLVVASSIPQDKIRAAEGLIMRRTGKEASVQVRKVASEEELASLRDRLRPATPAPVPQSVATIKADILGRLEPVLKEAWPAESAPILGYEIGFAPEGVVVRIRYESSRPLDNATEEVLMRLLGSRLQVESLRLILDFQRPAVRGKRTPPKPAGK